MPSRLEGSPCNDIRGHHVVSLAIGCEGIAAMLSGFGTPALGNVPPGHPRRGNSCWQVRHNPTEARHLLAGRGCGPRNTSHLVPIATAGSRQMQSLTMHQAVQEMLRAVHVEVSFEVIDWSTMTQRRGQVAQQPEQAGIHALYNS